MIVTPSLAKIFRAVADAIKAESGGVDHDDGGMNGVEVSMDTF